ncbi:hypothetical protein [Archaeoglobus neptunius]|uniref:hypothetical protein n=1 Tax=Archaeoglobus neptunius TaxID=2798580 RepID=UPI001927D2CE|nr:hypothetical protein [Archaeoglobus neptunius]
MDVYDVIIRSLDPSSKKVLYVVAKLNLEGESSQKVPKIVSEYMNVFNEDITMEKAKKALRTLVDMDILKMRGRTSRTYTLLFDAKVLKELLEESLRITS